MQAKSDKIIAIWFWGENWVCFGRIFGKCVVKLTIGLYWLGGGANYVWFVVFLGGL